MKPDKLDMVIMSHLQKDGRKSFTDIAKELNIAKNTVRNRVTRLQESGLLQIIGWVDPTAVGYTSPALIQIAIEPPNLIEEAAESLSQLPEARFVAMMTGEYPIIVDIRCRDRDHLTELITKRIYKIPGVISMRTNTYLHIYKYGPSRVDLADRDDVDRSK
ncbi:MAG: Lrp/AsnC family transcriptional regulator for asnA, asnC and gidA [Cellvibrionaceae bacterium]|jgi:Lrp/AsnC family transcriptional regulator for asnA, asnC and gidA